MVDPSDFMLRRHVYLHPRLSIIPGEEESRFRGRHEAVGSFHVAFGKRFHLFPLMRDVDGCKNNLRVSLVPDNGQRDKVSGVEVWQDACCNGELLCNNSSSDRLVTTETYSGAALSAALDWLCRDSWERNCIYDLPFHLSHWPLHSLRNCRNDSVCLSWLVDNFSGLVIVCQFWVGDKS